MSFIRPPYNALFPPPPSGNPLTSLGGESSLLGLAAVSRAESLPPFPTNALALGMVRPSYRVNALTLAQALSPAPAPPVFLWQYVIRRFDRILENLAITNAQLENGETKQRGVRACLNRVYWDSSSEVDNSFLIGSWGKHTRVRPSRDIDILFLLPPSVYHRFELRSGNRQSQLLQEVKGVLAQTYSQTTMRADGQVIVIPFNTIPIEIAPGFRCQDGSIIICDANGGGSYRRSTAEAEVVDLDSSNTAWNGNTRPLARMMKQWQRECNVPLKSFQLERLAVEFLRGWPYRLNDRFYYDWMVRDFLAYLISRANGSLVMPGTGEVVFLGSDWLSRAQTAYGYAVSACEYEKRDYETSAGSDWQKIFGSAAPITVA
jgi:Second Messenger Oligonucleotide or Dinucleotide Synthetase domain